MFACCFLTVGSEIVHELHAPLEREASADADMLQGARSVIKPQQQRSDGRRGDFAIPPEARYDAIAVTFMLDFQHDSLVRLVSPVFWFRDGSVQAGSFEATKPIFCDGGIVCSWR